MDEATAQKVANDFHTYLQTGDESKIQQHSKAYLKSALTFFQAHDRNHPWYQEIINRINFLERSEEARQNDRWWQRPLFVGITSAVIAGIFALVGGYRVGVENTVNNVPIQSNNRQYGNIYANQIVINENGKIQISGTAVNQATGDTIKFNTVSQDSVGISGQSQ